MKEEWIDIFDKYLQGFMSDGEKREFERDLAANSEMQHEFEEYNLLVVGIREASNARLQDKMDAVHKQHFEQQETPVVRMRNMRMLYAAAVVAVIVGAGLWAALSGSPSGTELYASNYEVYHGLSSTRGESSAEKIWQVFDEAYENKEYDQALIILGQAEVEEVDPDYLIHFYAGQCLMAKAAPDFKSAIKSFDKVLTSDNDFHAQSRWYTALASIKLGNTEDAISVLNALKKSSRYKSEEVEALLRDLE